MNNTWTWNRVRNKETGKIGVISCTTYGVIEDPSGKTWYTSVEVTWEGSVKEIFYGALEDNLGTLELINHDYSEIIPQLMKFLEADENRGILESVARRLDSEYFKEGILVYFTSPDHIIEKYSGSKYNYGPRYPYMIAKITDTSGKTYTNDYIISFELTLIPLSERVKGLSLEEIQKNLRLFRCIEITGYRSGWDYTNDAYVFLSRYDKEY